MDDSNKACERQDATVSPVCTQSCRPKSCSRRSERDTMASESMAAESSVCDTAPGKLGSVSCTSKIKSGKIVLLIGPSPFLFTFPPSCCCCCCCRCNDRCKPPWSVVRRSPTPNKTTSNCDNNPLLALPLVLPSMLLLLLLLSIGLPSSDEGVTLLCRLVEIVVRDGVRKGRNVKVDLCTPV